MARFFTPAKKYYDDYIIPYLNILANTGENNYLINSIDNENIGKSEKAMENYRDYFNTMKNLPDDVWL